MKGSSATSGRATEQPQPTGPSSGRRKRRSPITAEVFVLEGPSEPPDARFNAYRKDLADIALADKVIASHYAEPLTRTVKRPEVLRAGPSEASEPVCGLKPGDRFDILDNSVGWAWGYAGTDRRVGYVRSDAVE